MFEYGILENTPQLLAIEMKGELNTVEANKMLQMVDTYIHLPPLSLHPNPITTQLDISQHLNTSTSQHQ